MSWAYVARAHLQNGQPEPAITLYQRTLDDCLHLRPLQPWNIAVAESHLAAACAAAGRTRQAITLFRKAREGFLKTFGPNQLETLRAQVNLVQAYLSHGSPHERAEAIDLCQRTLARFERAGARAVHDRRTCRAILAEETLSRGDVNEAARLYECNLKDAEQVLGPDHPETVSCRSDLTFLHEEVGDVARAVQLSQLNLAYAEQVVGTDHPAAVAHRRHLAKLRSSLDQAVSQEKM